MDYRRSVPTLLRCLLLLASASLVAVYFLHLISPETIKLSSMRMVASTPSLEINRHKGKPLKFEVKGEDKAFLGIRPDIRTVINATNILEGCNGSGKEGWRDTGNCIEHLRYQEEEYLSIDHDVEPCDSEHKVKYHTYWRGPLTWRVSFMLKSFLFTQNLACSEMNIWLDADHDPDTLNATLKSPVIQPFMPLVSSGMIRLRAWTYPAAVYIPREFHEEDFPLDNMLRLRQHQIPRGPVAVSDSVRFVVLHQEGGLYVDMDTMFLKDVRPLLVAPDLAFAERWGAHPGAGEYNTAYLRLQANSSLSSRILQGAARMGLNFHPRVLGRMLAKSIQRKNDLIMFETGVFDPLWSFFDRDNIGRCTVPCLSNFGQFYSKDAIRGEWGELKSEDAIEQPRLQGNVGPAAANRTLSNFFRGAYIHHIHNQWHKQVIPGSWVWVADQTYNQFFKGERPNPYGEHWQDSIDFSAEEAGYRP